MAEGSTGVTMDWSKGAVLYSKRVYGLACLWSFMNMENMVDMCLFQFRVYYSRGARVLWSS
jgi:hypothetical protein